MHVIRTYMYVQIYMQYSFLSIYSMVLSFGKHMGPFSYAPPSEFAGMFEAAGSEVSQEAKQRPFIHLGTTEDLTVSGPVVRASYQGFVPAPIDTQGRPLSDPLQSIRGQLAHNLHEVWAKNKIEAGYRFGEVRGKKVVHCSI